MAERIFVKLMIGTSKALLSITWASTMMPSKPMTRPSGLIQKMPVLGSTKAMLSITRASTMMPSKPMTRPSG